MINIKDEKKYDLAQDLDVDEELCPECKTTLKIWREPDGTDDYSTFASCEGCGYQEST